MATEGGCRHEDEQLPSLREVLKSKDLDVSVFRTVEYQKRLGIGHTPLFFINGVPIVRDDRWVQEMSMRINKDLQTIQRVIMEEEFEEDTWLPGYLLSNAFDCRNSLIVPEDPKNIRIVDVAKVWESRGEILDDLPRVKPEKGALESVHMVVVGDFDTEDGMNLVITALGFREEHGDAEILLLHNPGADGDSQGSAIVHRSFNVEKRDAPQIVLDIKSTGDSAAVSSAEAEESSQYWAAKHHLAADFGFSPGSSGIVVNGRAVGPIPSGSQLTMNDFAQLMTYERKKRITPISKATTDLGFDSKISSPLDFAKLTSLAALSTISDVPEGIFDSTSDIRVNLFDKWETSRSVITVSNSDDPTINIVASIDPTSEAAQRWLPILKVLSKLAGVRLKIFLNPREEISELPIKRFYRYVLDSEPAFSDDGSLSKPKASFSGVPVEALLTLGMDVPSSWLVAPKDSAHDLDNIKLSSLKANTDVDATYALEHILIEGHSRDTTINSPPRGVQLVLGADNDPHLTDTIIMANLGYFQFKTQPGLWKINLKPGRSENIFNIDSAGSSGYTPQLGDDNNDVALLSFQGKTLFPRLSRKKGHEMEDVLETAPKPGSAMDFVSKGLNFASGILSSVRSTGTAAEEHADINIFSVASGHLYERMLNIMMVSVMRNTKHSVKFWFIEQFLSPSFKSFLPHLAAEYGFSYEMVTYKWPHWLRGQREKQREIWGYKILFLDVLFPLSLDKVIFVDADQIVRTDMHDLTILDLDDAPYGFTPMCDSRTEMEGFRFWKQGYWKNFLKGAAYHISALYVVDLTRFRALAAGDRLRGQYQMLSADPNSLSNLDQDLPNHMQHAIPIKSLPQDWLWCETWCADEGLTSARTIDLCNNPMTKEPKLDRARRQVPEWTVYDEEIAALTRRVAGEEVRDEMEEDDGARGWRKDEL